MRNRLEIRAQEGVARCLIRRLMVPRVYFEVEWPEAGKDRYDVLVIDRDGVGDPHLVEIREKAADALSLAPRLLAAPAPYRWLAFLRGTEDEASMSALLSQEPLYLKDTAGRVGIIEIVHMAGDTFGANVRLAAERFPTPAYDLASAFSRAHTAQMQFGQ